MERDNLARAETAEERCRQLESELAAAIAVLRDVEWSAGYDSSFCPECRWPSEENHRMDCKLAAMIGAKTHE